MLVSEVKKSSNYGTTYSNLNAGADSTTTSLWTSLGITTNAQKEEFYKTSHTLTFYYMERGMWESNMRIQFNFPTHDTLELSKEVDTSNVNANLRNFFNNVSASFTVKNKVTHYGTQAARVDMGDFISQSEIRDYGSAHSGMDLTAASDAKYTKDGSATLYGLNSSGGLTIRRDETATFVNEFRRGSYLSVVENLSNKERQLYTTTWKLYEDGKAIISYDNRDSKTVSGRSTSPLAGTGYAITDNRTEKNDNKSGGNYNDYNTETRPQENAIVFRSYSKPDTPANIELKTIFTNKVNTGKLIIEKTAAVGSEELTGTYSFTIVLSDIGGVGLSYVRNSQTVNTYTVNTTLSAGQTYELDGIPVGTRFTVTEATPNDGSQFYSVTSTDTTSTANGATVSGVIGYDVTNASTNGEYETVTFVNRKQKEVISLTIVKKWDDVLGTELPQTIRFQLQRKTATAGWQAVDGYTSFELKPGASGVSVSGAGTNTVSWSKTIENLDKYSGVDTPYYIQDSGILCVKRSYHGKRRQLQHQLYGNIQQLKRSCFNGGFSDAYGNEHIQSHCNARNGRVSYVQFCDNRYFRSRNIRNCITDI